MKRTGNIFINIDINAMHAAVDRASRGHGNSRELVRFHERRERNERVMLDALHSGHWRMLVGYRRLEKTNSNGKRRKIDSPNLYARIYQHLTLNLLEPLYDRKDNLNGLNCKAGCGITARDRRRSVVRRMKHIYYDEARLGWCLVVDQRKCYEHVTERAFRKGLKTLTSDKRMIDFAVAVTFVDGRLPIGTPSSPFVHHVAMLEFDMFVRTLTRHSVRYADDNFLAFETKEEAQSAKWRIKNWWWYELGMRAKRHTVSIRPMVLPLDFCGYVYHRGSGGHGKGYVTVRRSIADRAARCATAEGWASYFGLMKHADEYGRMSEIEERMKLRELTDKIRIDRTMDAPHVEVKDLAGVAFSLREYEIRRDGKGQANWVKCLIGVEETDGGEPTGRIAAREFHGNYQGIIGYLLALEAVYGRGFLPIEDAEIVNECGYIFKGSTNQIKYLD